MQAPIELEDFSVPVDGVRRSVLRRWLGVHEKSRKEVRMPRVVDLVKMYLMSEF